MALPDSVREVIGARVGRLGQGCRAGAVGGGGHRPGLRPRPPGPSHDDHRGRPARHPRRRRRASLVRELADTPGRYNFAHALIQHTLYEDLGPTRRARAHRQVAEALEDLCGDRPGARVGELARHWFSATQPIDLAKAIELLPPGGRRRPGRPGPGRRPALLRPGPRPLPPGHRPRSGPGTRPGHRPRHRPAPDG